MSFTIRFPPSTIPSTIDNFSFIPWNKQIAFALRDAVIDNYLTADTYDALNKASSTADVEAAINKQGVYLFTYAYFTILTVYFDISK